MSMATIIDAAFTFGHFSIRRRIKWALSGFLLSSVSRKLSNLSNPPLTATSSVYYPCVKNIAKADCTLPTHIYHIFLSEYSYFIITTNFQQRNLAKIIPFMYTSFSSIFDLIPPEKYP